MGPASNEGAQERNQDEEQERLESEGVGEGEGSAAAGPVPQDAVLEKEQELASLRDQLLRLAADFDNFRKRTRREQEDIRRYGIETLLTDILPVLDNFDRALAHTAGEQNPLVQGVRMVAKQFHDVLGRYGVQSFTSVGDRFDPERHEAVGQMPGGDVEPGTVLEEAQKGYMLHDRLLRPARVVVAAAVANEESAGEPAQPEE